MLKNWNTVSEMLGNVNLEEFICHYLDQRTEHIYKKNWMMEQNQVPYGKQKKDIHFFTVLMLGKTIKDNELKKNK